MTPSVAQPDLERVYAKLLLIRRAEEEVEIGRAHV